MAEGSFVEDSLAGKFLANGSLVDGTSIGGSWAGASVFLGSTLSPRDILACWFFPCAGESEIGSLSQDKDLRTAGSLASGSFTAESSGKESLLDGGNFADRSCACGNKADGSLIASSSMAMSWGGYTFS